MVAGTAEGEGERERESRVQRGAHTDTGEESSEESERVETGVSPFSELS